MIISEVLRRSALDLDIAVLHPGGGQYDTLSLVTFEGNSVVHVNRNGVNALANDTLVESIFDTAAKSPAKAAEQIVRAINDKGEKSFSASKRNRIEVCVKIANFLAFNLRTSAHCEWGWTDSQYGVGPNSELSKFEIPDAWKKQKGLFTETTWESGVYLLMMGEKPYAAVNMVTGEFVDSKGLGRPVLAKGFEDDGLARSHIGFMLIVEDADGKLVMGEEAHITDARKKRMSYAEEYYSLPEQSPIYEFECDQEEAILNWIMAERNLLAPGEDIRDYLS
jgi:hypothetical protein